MEFTIQEFPEAERLFFLELSYFDFKGLDLEYASFQKPILLSKLMEFIEQAENSARGMIPKYNAYKEKAVKRLRMIFKQSTILRNMKLVRYLNDNGNEYGTTKNDWKSGLVSYAYSDEAGNIVLIFRGYEVSAFAESFHDFGSQALIYFGIPSMQFQRAQHFFHEVAAMAKGNIILAGDRLGGSLALYTYIKEKENFPHISGTATNVNKNILLWKKLKADQYLTTDDFIFKRIVKKEIQEEMIDRIVQELEQKAKNEKDSFSQKMTACFEQLEETQQDYYHALPALMERLKDDVQADAMILWFRHADKNGEYIIPYLVQGTVMPGLHHLKLREGETVICAPAFLGIGKLFPDISEMGMFSFVQPDGGHESMMCVPVFCNDKPIGALHLSKLGEHRKFDGDIYQKVMLFAEKLGKYLQPFQREIFYDDDDYLLQIYDRTIQKPVFSIAEYENKTMAFSRRQTCKGVAERVTGQTLGSDEIFKYRGQCFDAAHVEELHELVEEHMGILFEKEYEDFDRLSVLLEPFNEQEESRKYLQELNRLLPFMQFEKQPFGTLSVKEKLMFHTCMVMAKRKEIIIAYPYPYHLNEKTREWADSMLRFLAAGEKKTILKFVIES